MSAWDEYLAWTRGADPHEYEATEALAWERLQLALLDVAAAPSSPPSNDPLPRA